MSQIATTATQPRRVTALSLGRCLAAFMLAALIAISLRAAIAPTGHSQPTQPRTTVVAHQVQPRPVVNAPLPCGAGWHYEFISSGNRISARAATCSAKPRIDSV